MRSLQGLPGNPTNEFVGALLANESFMRTLEKRLGPLAKADTINEATNLAWYDLSMVVQNLYPYRELIPCISKLPRVPADGGNAHHWKRIVSIGDNLSPGVSEGNRGARVSLTQQDMLAAYRTLGRESSVTFEARLGGHRLTPEVLGTAVQAALRWLMIQEEQTLINSDAGLPLGTTNTPTLVAGTVAGTTGAFASGTVYVAAVGLTGQGIINTTPWNSSANTGGIQGQVTKTNADNSTDTYGGGSAKPSAIASTGTSGTQCVTATTSLLLGALGYAWFVGSSATPSAMYFAGITQSNQAVLSKYPASTNQPLSSLYVGGVGQDNSTNLLLPDGILTQIFGAITGPDPGRGMATTSVLPTGVSLSAGGSLLYNMAAGNTGLTIAGSNVFEFDQILRAAYEQYKLGFTRILMSAEDIQGTVGAMLGQSSSASLFRLLLEADEVTGRIVAGRRVTSYVNKWLGNTLDIEVHPWVPAGTIIFWSDRIPYELSGVPNILEARVRQDYYQIQWPWKSRRYEYGVYVDETFPCYFTPAFAVITNVNPSTGNLIF